MLEEMSYVTSDQQDGKKVYTITDEGRSFLEERGQAAEQVRSQMRHHWNPLNMMGAAETSREFRRLGGLLARRGRSVGPEKMGRIQEVISRARKEIDEIIKEIDQIIEE
jgi:DNA-binding PadR family transcriptional regulator